VDEKKLIRECLAQNRVAQQELYKRFASKMLAVCYRYAHSIEEAEDALQEGFIKVFGNLKKYKGEGSFEGWIRRIMVNTSITLLNSKPAFDPIDDLSDDENNWQAAELNAAEVMEEIRQLPRGYRMVFNLYAIEGYSHKEIAAMLKITESTSRSQYTRSRFLLMKRLNLKITPANHE
jgi:RNA polymerase sigma factor (sigma-70 family)